MTLKDKTLSLGQLRQFVNSIEAPDTIPVRIQIMESWHEEGEIDRSTTSDALGVNFEALRYVQLTDGEPWENEVVIAVDHVKDDPEKKQSVDEMIEEMAKYEIAKSHA